VRQRGFVVPLSLLCGKFSFAVLHFLCRASWYDKASLPCAYPFAVHSLHGNEFFYFL
jgi:hypothetical protein